MNIYISLVLTAAILFGRQPEALADTTAAARSVILVDSQRTKAMLQNDAATLDRILAPDVTFITGDGELNPRAEYLSDVKKHNLTYTRLDYSGTSVRLFGSTAILVSKAHVEGRYESKILRYNLRVTRVYVRTRGVWQLEAIQSTRTAK